MTSRANAVCILKILTDYSDADHILRMQDLIAKMKALYSLDADRRTIYSAIELLIQLGHDISNYSENGVGYFLRERDFETSEIHLLMDAVYSHQAISPAQTQKLIRKLQKLLNVHDRQTYRNLTVVKADRKTGNPEVFLNIEQLDEAIQEKRQIRFIYLSYGMDKKLHSRRKEPYIVNPYRLIFIEPRKDCVKANKRHPFSQELEQKNNLIERMYYYGKDTEGNAEGVRGQPGVQQYHRDHGSYEGDVPGRAATGDGERVGSRAGVRKKSTHVKNGCRKQAPELSQRVFEKDSKNSTGSSRSEGAPGPKRRI